MKVKDYKNLYIELLLIFLISGIFGFIYETIFYRIDLGYFVKRGTTFGPWIPIYGFGGLIITLFCYKQKETPFKVFILGALLSGTLEFLTGFLLYNISNIRLWDYNNEILNYGNIGGYICLRSVLFFGFSGILLIYSIIPNIKKLLNKQNKVIIFTSVIISMLFLLDFIISDIIL